MTAPDLLAIAPARLGMPSKDAVARVVSDVLGVRLEDMKRRSQRRRLVRARQVAYAMMRRHCRLNSYSAIGRYWQRDHCTVWQGLRTLEAVLERDPALAAKVATINARLEGHVF